MAAPVHTIISETHRLTIGDDGLWRTLGPALIASLVPGVALWFGFKQSEASNKLAREQLAASNKVAERQAGISRLQIDLARRRQTHDERAGLLAVWRMFATAKSQFFGLPGLLEDKENLASRMYRLHQSIAEAALEVEYYFGPDVAEPTRAVERIAFEISYRLTQIGYEDKTGERPDLTEVLDVIGDVSARASQLTDTARAAVRAYTVHGLRSNNPEVPLDEGSTEA